MTKNDFLWYVVEIDGVIQVIAVNVKDVTIRGKIISGPHYSEEDAWRSVE